MKLGLASAAVLAEPWLASADNAIRVIGSFFGDGVDCTNKKESQNPQYPADAIAVPSGGTIRTDNGSYELNGDSRIRLEAAAIAYLNKFAPLIILLGVEKSPSEENSAKVYLQEAFSRLTKNTASIPEEAILMETNSINTATNMEELSKIAEERKIGRVVVVTNGFHKDRATLLACSHDVAAYPISAEELVASQGPEGQIAVSKNNVSWVTIVKEAFEKLTMLWDPKGEAQTLLRGITR